MAVSMIALMFMSGPPHMCWVKREASRHHTDEGSSPRLRLNFAASVSYPANPSVSVGNTGRNHLSVCQIAGPTMRYSLSPAEGTVARRQAGREGAPCPFRGSGSDARDASAQDRIGGPERPLQCCPPAHTGHDSLPVQRAMRLGVLIPNRARSPTRW